MENLNSFRDVFKKKLEIAKFGMGYWWVVPVCPSLSITNEFHVFFALVVSNNNFWLSILG